jgi:hypothetical protein
VACGSPTPPETGSSGSGVMIRIAAPERNSPHSAVDPNRIGNSTVTIKVQRILSRIESPLLCEDFV